MVQGPLLIVILVAAIAFIVLATTRLRLHPFIALLVAAYGIGFSARMPLLEIDKTVAQGFGGILAYIGIVIVLGTVIGTILEKSGAAVTMAETILKVVGPKRPALAMSLIGYIVSIPVFCDSGYVILSSLKRSLGKKAGVSAVTMSIALATGLYATHTLVPPTPGPIAAAGSLGMGSQLGLVILFGLGIAIVTAGVGYLWAVFCGKKLQCAEDFAPAPEEEAFSAKLPAPFWAFSPIFVPILLIALGSVAAFPTHPFGGAGTQKAVLFLGQPLNALLVGLLFCMKLLPNFSRETLTGWFEEGLKGAAVIILITGAGGALGAVLKATPIGDYLGQTLCQWKLGILLPFIIAASLKTAQGSSTVALVTTSALVAPLLGALGLGSDVGRVLTVMAIGAGAMTVSHANDSYFWVVSQFSGMDVATAYRSHTVATLLQGLATIAVVGLLALVLV